MSYNENKDIYFENEAFSIKNRKLVIKSNNTSITLSKNQSIFLGCLLRGCANKKDIIESIWPGSDFNSKDNNYRQLLFQTRTLLRQAGLDNSLLRVSRNNLCLNMNLLSPNAEDKKKTLHIYKDSGLIFVLNRKEV